MSKKQNYLISKITRRCIVCISFLMLFVIAFGQDNAYTSMLVEGAFWDDVRRDGATLCGYSKENSYRYEVGGDTLINQQAYKYFYRYPLETGNSAFCTPYWVEYEKKEMFTGAFFREDTAKRQVFIYVNEAFYAPSELSDFVGNEYLLYDFSLNVGDTLKSEYSGYLIVDSIDSMELYGGEKKVKWFDFGGFGYGEQVGWLNLGGFYTTPKTWGIEDYVTFYCEVDNEVIFSEGRWTYLESQIRDTNKRNFEVQVAAGILTINSIKNNLLVNVSTLDGRVLEHKQLNPGATLEVNTKSAAIVIVQAINLSNYEQFVDKIYIP